MKFAGDRQVHLHRAIAHDDGEELMMKSEMLLRGPRRLRLRGPRNNICYSGHVKYFSD